MIADTMLPEFDMEMAGTRRVLERMPDGRFDWQPHAKSMALGRLASHVATLPEWATMVVTSDSFNVAGVQLEIFATTEELVEKFDAAANEARAAIAKTPDEAWGQPWTLKAGEQVIFTLPRIAVYRTSVLNHLIHHRAQLTVYLRLNDVAVPGLYGPSADEQ